MWQWSWCCQQPNVHFVSFCFVFSSKLQHGIRLFRDSIFFGSVQHPGNVRTICPTQLDNRVQPPWSAALLCILPLGLLSTQNAPRSLNCVLIPDASHWAWARTHWTHACMHTKVQRNVWLRAAAGLKQGRGVEDEEGLRTWMLSSYFHTDVFVLSSMSSFFSVLPHLSLTWNECKMMLLH